MSIQVSDLASIIQLQIDGNCCRPHIPTRAIRLGEIWYGDGAVPPTEYLFCKVLATVGGTALYQVSGNYQIRNLNYLELYVMVKGRIFK